MKSGGRSPLFHTPFSVFDAGPLSGGRIPSGPPLPEYTDRNPGAGGRFYGQITGASEKTAREKGCYQSSYGIRK